MAEKLKGEKSPIFIELSLQLRKSDNKNIYKKKIRKQKHNDKKSILYIKR